MDETLIKLVKEEAKKLREVATKEEIDKLDLIELNPHDSVCCIYGQMTGNCTTERAKQLIEMCCTEVYHNHEDHYMRRSYDNLYKIRTDFDAHRRLYHYMTPIELFILECGTYNHSKLLNYLRKETETLIFEFV